jgi:tRNA(adenine34) deaminase
MMFARGARFSGHRNVFYPTANDEAWMRLALREAETAGALGEVPVGAVVVVDGAVVGRGFNRTEKSNDPTAHAEIVALRDAGESVGRWKLVGSTVYISVEPCVMCAGALWTARVGRVVYGASEPKTGAVHSRYQLLSDGYLGRTIPAVGGCLAGEAEALLRRFFQERR